MRKSNIVLAIRRHGWKGLSILGLSLFLGGCSSVSMLNPVSSTSGAIANLTWAIFGLAAFVFVVVEGWLIYTIIRYRRKPGAKLPNQIAENIPLEIGWTAFPAVVLAIVFALTLGTLGYLTTPPHDPNATSTDPTKSLTIRVIAHQWWWEFQYKDLGFYTANEIHVPVGAEVYFQIESGDVAHSFWVPELGPKQDAIPGHVNFTWWKPDKPGKYYGHCAEYCGTQHAMMNIIVFADSPQDFTTWADNQKKPAETNGLSADALEGKKVVESHACVICHNITGTKANGRLAPDLTHFNTRTTFAGASIDNNGVNVAQWVLNPQSLKPDTRMPNVGLTQAQAQMVAVYLESLK